MLEWVVQLLCARVCTEAMTYTFYHGNKTFLDELFVHNIHQLAQANE